MTPKKEAIKLIDKFSGYVYMDEQSNKPVYFFQKQCALICCDEILDVELMNIGYEYITVNSAKFIQYWEQVKTEIIKL